MKMNMIRTISVYLAMVMGVAMVGASARADLTICNKTDKSITFAFTTWNDGCSGSTKWRDKGWWNMSPGQCKLVDTDSFSDKYIYYYARSTDGAYVWTSNTFNWMIPTTAHNTCWSDKVNCQQSDGNPCPGTTWPNHREYHTTARNFTLNLTH